MKIQEGKEDKSNQAEKKNRQGNWQRSGRLCLNSKQVQQEAE